METLLDKDRKIAVWDSPKYSTGINHYDFLNSFNHSNNLDVFKETISKIRDLKKRNVIDDKQFADIIIMIATNFIENEVELRVNYKINKSLFSYFK